MKDDKQILKEIMLEACSNNDALFIALNTEIDEELDKPDSEVDLSVIDDCVEEGLATTDFEYTRVDIEKQKSLILDQVKAKDKKRSSFTRLTRVAAAFCIICLGLFLINTVSVQAFQVNLFDEIVEFGKGVLKFDFTKDNGKPLELNTTEEDPYGLIQECEKCQLSPLLPTYIPTGFKLYNFQVDEVEGLRNDITILFKNNDQTISFDICIYQNNNTPEFITPNESNQIEKKQINGYDIYVTTNETQKEAIFKVENSTYFVGADIELGEFTKILESMK